METGGCDDLSRVGADIVGLGVDTDRLVWLLDNVVEVGHHCRGGWPVYEVNTIGVDSE